MLTLIWLGVFLIALVLYFKEVYSRFSRCGVKHLNPVPLMGNMLNCLLRWSHLAEDFDKLYHAFPEERFVGRYEFLKSTVVLRDVELVKKIAIKHFENFLDHRMLVDDRAEPLFGRNLFSLRGQEWKDMRSTLSPAFTSSKIRLMVPFIMDVSEQMIKSLKSNIKKSGVGYLDVDCKDLTTRYTNDVIASCAFGLKVDSHTDPDNEFYEVGRKTASSGFRSVLVFLGYMSFPQIMKKLNVRLLSETTTKFFNTIVLGTMNDRQKNNVIRNDMIHLLMEAKKVGYLDVDCKDLTTRYTNDVIASCAFGLKVDSHTDPDNEFYEVGRKTASSGFRSVLVFLGYMSFPQIMKKLNVRLLSETTTKFFNTIVLGTMNDRQKNNVIRNDMIHLLMEAKKGKLTYEEKPAESSAGFATVEESDVGKGTNITDWSDDDLVAQAVIFFVAGFETVSSVMSFLLHELAVNPDVQERLAQEIKEHAAKNGGKFDFGSIQNMTYLDMVVSEVLRLWPPAIGTDRVCNKEYNLGKPNAKADKDFILRKGEAVIIPIWSFHHDPEFFPDPYKFDPERFSEENKHSIKPFTYIPFGIGPRNCIGSRFALCEVKVMIYQLLLQMEVSPCEKTYIPAKLCRNTFNLRIDGGHWVRFKVRN